MYFIHKLQRISLLLFAIYTFQYQASAIDNALDTIDYVPARTYKRYIEPTLYITKTLANSIGTAMLATSLALDASDLSIAVPPPGLNLNRFKSFMGWFGVVLVGGSAAIDSHMAHELERYRAKPNNAAGVQPIGGGVNLVADTYDTVDLRRFEEYHNYVGAGRILLGLASGVFGLMFASDQSYVDLSDDPVQNLALNIALPAAGAFSATMYKEITHWHLHGGN